MYAPDRLLVANVQGRALISDHYLVAEWRADPWKGFDLDEGVWARRRRREYEPDERWYSQSKVTPAQALFSVQPWGRKRKGHLSAVQDPRTVTRAENVETIESGTVLDRFDGSGTYAWANHELVATLIRLIDGEPEHWTASGPTAPIDAWDKKKWLGAVMPIRRS